MLVSGTVGPEPITEGSSPGTSEIIKVRSCAGLAASARRPPLMAERCLRTVFISPMGAPLRRRARLMACLSAREMPSAGSDRSEEAPPDIRQSTRSSAERPCTMCSMRVAAAWPASSGTGWPASTTSIRASGPTPCSYRVTTRPLSFASFGQSFSTSRAMAAAAFPAPTTSVRPRGGGDGRKLGTQCSGSTAFTAAWNISSSSPRASITEDAPKTQKFFASFFQKRSACLASS